MKNALTDQVFSHDEIRQFDAPPQDRLLAQHAKAPPLEERPGRDTRLGEDTL
jgi:hypothetical protein